MISEIKKETWCGLSSDTKPTENVSNGQTILEMDTRDVYIFDEEGNRWYPM